MRNDLRIIMFLISQLLEDLCGNQLELSEVKRNRDRQGAHFIIKAVGIKAVGRELA